MPATQGPHHVAQNSTSTTWPRSEANVGGESVLGQSAATTSGGSAPIFGICALRFGLGSSRQPPDPAVNIKTASAALVLANPMRGLSVKWPCASDEMTTLPMASYYADHRHVIARWQAYPRVYE